nr:nose resistant to fluoxetine protein 6 [Onthophagus taurus]
MKLKVFLIFLMRLISKTVCDTCTKLSENPFLKTIIEGGNITNGLPIDVLLGSIVDDETILENELKGKLCLKNITECIEADGDYKPAADQLTRFLLNRSPPFDLSKVEGVSERCKISSRKFIDDLNNFKFWALQMYDASAKLPSGILSGNVIQFGDFDLCMKSSNPTDDIYGKYCLPNVQFTVPNSPYFSALHKLIHSHNLLRSNLRDPGHRVPRYSSIQWGLCIPDGCSNKDVELGVREGLKYIFNGTDFEFDMRLDEEMCQSSRVENWNLSTKIGFGFFGVVILLEILSTLYELFYKGSKNDLIVAFSMFKNIKKVFATSKGENDIEAVHVIRFLNAIMLLAAHKSMALLYLPYVNRTDSSESLGQAWTVIGRAASLYTDPFIMISGTLSAYSLFGRLKKGNKIKIFQEYISRILRILPTFAALIIFCTFVLPWTNSGPLWNSVVTHHSDICKKYWWRNMLFIHNYFGFKNMCLTHTHHVGIDTQLFFLSPIFVLLVWKWPKRGLFTLFTIACISTGMRYYATYTKKLSNYVHFGTSTDQLFKTADHMYILPPHRLTVYIMGIILAYILREYKNVQLKPIYVKIGNFLAITSFCGALFVPSFMGDLNYIYNPVDAAWYAAYAPIMWCLCFAWFIYITHVGYRGYFNYILSHPIPKLWTNISYTVYLTQFPIFFYNVGITKHSDDYGVIRKTVNLLETFWIIFFSIALTLLFEMPSQNIRNLIFNGKSQIVKNEKKVEKNSNNFIENEKEKIW